MKLLGALIVVASLILGVVGAATAYLPRISAPDDRLAGLTLNAPAGRRTDEGGRAVPIAGPGTVLTPAVLAELRAAGVERVRVKEFALGRWSGAWMFGLGCAGLIAGGLVMRRAARDTTGGRGPGGGAESTLAQIREIVEALRRDLPGMPDDAARGRAVIERIGVVQRDLAPEFVAARPALVARAGMAGFARVMDRFAAAERQMNRAWSASADGVAGEAARCLDGAAEKLAATEAVLRGLQPSR